MPIEKAMEKYPGADWFITQITDPFSAYQNLLDNGIETDRIHYIRADANKRCPILGSTLHINGLGLNACCQSQAFHIALKGNIKDDIKSYNARCRSLAEALKMGMYNTCTFCYKLEDGVYEKPLALSQLTLATGLPGGDKCNLKCFYCGYGANLSACKYENNVYEIIKYFDDRSYFGFLAYAGAELSVSTYREDILKLWNQKKWKGMIETNGTIFCEGIADLLRDKLIFIRTSVDAGTKETYAMIKGVDCFDKTLDNLQKYAATGGEVRIKYIVIEGANDNERDIAGFVNFAAQIKAFVDITHEFSETGKNGGKISENVFTAMSLIIKMCREFGINAKIMQNYVHPDDLNRLRADGLI